MVCLRLENELSGRHPPAVLRTLAQYQKIFANRTTPTKVAVESTWKEKSPS